MDLAMRGLSPIGKLLYLFLKDEGGSLPIPGVFESLPETLPSLLELDEDTVSQALQELKDRGLLIYEDNIVTFLPAITSLKKASAFTISCVTKKMETLPKNTKNIIKYYISTYLADKTKTPSKVEYNNQDFPANEIIELYHKTLPTLPKVTAMQNEDLKNLQELWNEYPDMTWWEGYFAKVKESPFLLGQRKNFIASLPWLAKKKNAEKVLADTYQERTRTNISEETHQEVEERYLNGVYKIKEIISKLKLQEQEI